MERMPRPVLDPRADEDEMLGISQAIFEIPMIDLPGQLLVLGFISCDESAERSGWG